MDRLIISSAKVTFIIKKFLILELQSMANRRRKILSIVEPEFKFKYFFLCFHNYKNTLMVEFRKTKKLTHKNINNQTVLSYLK